MQIPRFASLKNDDDDDDSDRKDLMPMQEDDDFCIQTINSDNESGIVVDSIHYQNRDDDSDNETLHEEPKGTPDDEEEKELYDFDEWFEEQMDIHENRKITGKDDNFVNFWTTSLAIV